MRSEVTNPLYLLTNPLYLCPGALACTVRDLGDGAYRCSFKADKAGMYTCYIELEGVDIDGSPFTTIVTRRPEILRLKWNQPTLSGDESRPVACAVSVAIGSFIFDLVNVMAYRSQSAVSVTIGRGNNWENT
ncbi:hypothetical protein T492DRAFT_846811 [Pavlovales sp. CCMP2436]|nr:hypothetical protein T492DRAFT_846811 [Pavlovales sp. CCMP2436]